ncbi:hypothetical protein OH76DRAFT_1102555 [Lentinus brumalis]|uniref:Uncharacterized protein n=1 Tax=Lentinus brumalis TaxID=2498619 RepID=A0A371CVL8_9APHY|nr:hypothetical protein OH76DRAFT_1102555 [Polyporus brumalis]
MSIPDASKTATLSVTSMSMAVPTLQAQSRFLLPTKKTCLRPSLRSFHEPRRGFRAQTATPLRTVSMCVCYHRLVPDGWLSVPSPSCATECSYCSTQSRTSSTGETSSGRGDSVSESADGKMSTFACYVDSRERSTTSSVRA